MKAQAILAFETSCDDCAVAIIDGDGSILSDVICSQTAEHERFGGVVPEVGSRAHIEQISWACAEAFRKAQKSPKDITAVAATMGPGLLGPLLVGAQFAKGFALAQEVPFVGIHHIEGHIMSGFSEKSFPTPPFVALIVSGGHTTLYHCHENACIQVLGETRDDAAGEAFDKIARMVGLSYPGGRLIDQLAQEGCLNQFNFPLSLQAEGCLDFSFSGLKTSVRNQLLALTKTKETLDSVSLRNLCASVQNAIVEVLVNKAIEACRLTQMSRLVLGGGVCANSSLRDKLQEKCSNEKINLYLPEKRLCTDNAVMIARAALRRMTLGHKSPLSLDVSAQLCLKEADRLYDLNYP